MDRDERLVATHLAARAARGLRRTRGLLGRPHGSFSGLRFPVPPPRRLSGVPVALPDATMGCPDAPAPLRIVDARSAHAGSGLNPGLSAREGWPRRLPELSWRKRNLGSA